MSDNKPGLGGLFVNKKASADVPGAPKPKNVKQRWMYVGIAGVGFLVLASSFFGKKQDTVQAAPKPVPMVNVSPTNVDANAWQKQAGVQLAQNEAETDTLKAQTAALKEQLEALKAKNAEAAAKPAPAMPSTIVPPPMQGGPTQASPTVPPPPPTFPAATAAGQGSSATPASVMIPLAPSMAVPQEPRIFKPEAKAASAASGDTVKAKVRYTKNPYSGFLPAGAFAPVALLNGLDAGTSSATQANPLPVLMTITDQATLPGAAKYSVKSCFVLGTGYGDLSAERVYVRYSRMSCVDKSDRLVLSADVSGYLVDSDGKIGLRGKVVDRQGAKLGKAVLAGFAQGLSGAFGQAQGITTTSAIGATTSIGGSDALRAAGLNGAQSAAQQLAQFYLKEAQAIFPVITVDAGRTGTIVFTDNAQLTWSQGDSQYVKDVRPEN